MSKKPKKRKAAVIGVVVVLIATVGVLCLFSGPGRKEELQTENENVYGKPREKPPALDVTSGPVSAIPDIEGIPPIELALDGQPVAKTAEKKLEIPPIDWRTQLLDSLAEETIEESARNFHESTDLCLAISSISSFGTTMSTKTQVTTVTRLTRVRKLMEIGRQDPDRVVPVVRDVMREALAGYKNQRETYVRESRRNGPETPPEWELHFQMRILCGTYILAELGDHESLPLMLQSYRQHDEKGLPSAAPPGFTLYAMHLLVSSFPEERLSTQATHLRAKYLKAAECIPPHRQVEVTRWSAAHLEADPRIVLFDPGKLTLEGQETMTINVWPHSYSDGMEFNVEDGAVPARTEELFALLEDFVEEAFPDCNGQ